MAQEQAWGMGGHLQDVDVIFHGPSAAFTSPSMADSPTSSSRTSDVQIVGRVPDASTAPSPVAMAWSYETGMRPRLMVL